MRSMRKIAASRVRGLRATRVAVAHGSDGPVSVRLFAPANAACDPSDAAQAVMTALDKFRLDIAQVVLPAGFGILPEVTLEDDWTDLHVGEIQVNATRWAENFRHAMDRRFAKVPVIVGLDAGVKWPGYESCGAVQTLAVIGRRGLEALGWKSLPASGEYLVAGGDGKRIPRGLVERNGAFVDFSAGRALLLVCQDGIAFGTTRKKPLASSRSGQVRAAFKSFLRKRRPTWAFNAIHKLPLKAGGRIPSSFTNSHRVLITRGIEVVSVAGLNSAEPLGACFERVRERLHCTTPHIDVLLSK
jgi:hypothetical protein